MVLTHFLSTSEPVLFQSNIFGKTKNQSCKITKHAAQYTLNNTLFKNFGARPNIQILVFRKT